MKKKHRFNWGDKVRLIGGDNPYRGELGEFVIYDKHKLEKERLIVFVYSDGSEHYFYKDEVGLISKFGVNNEKKRIHEKKKEEKKIKTNQK